MAKQPIKPDLVDPEITDRSDKLVRGLVHLCMAEVERDLKVSVMDLVVRCRKTESENSDLRKAIVRLEKKLKRRR